MGKEIDVKLVLENGVVFKGYSFGCKKEVVSELVFNTSMVGYQEILSDLSYADQMVVMTYPLIGNYGMTDEDYECKTPICKGFVVREYNDTPSNFRYTKTMSEVMEENSIPGISGIDTRKLTRILKNEGALLAIITDIETPDDEALGKIKAYKKDENLLSKVSCVKPWYSRTPNHKYNVVALDFGIKHSFIKAMNLKGCNVTVVPQDTTKEGIEALRPDALFLSNGPGDPAEMDRLIDLIKEFIGKTPILAVGLGHQLVCLACGAKSFRMKCGHMGANHPVRNLESKRIYTVCQNHSYCIDKESLEDTNLEVLYENVLDGTVEGVKSEKDKIITAQFYPEASDNTKDESCIYNKFLSFMEKESV